MVTSELEMLMRPVALSELAEKHGLEHRGPDREIATVGALNTRSPSVDRMLTYIIGAGLIPKLEERDVAACVVPAAIADSPEGRSLLVTDGAADEAFYALYALYAQTARDGLWETIERDTLWYTQLAIDSERWPEVPPRPGDGAEAGKVTVLHAPNHRRIKDTDALEAAIATLHGEGFKVELDLLEGFPNEEVREAMLGAGIVVGQLVAGYAMFAIEGMSAGKPVMTALSWLPAEIRATEALRECPLVDANLETVTGELRRLVTDPGRRRELGAESRRFAERYHSLDPAGETWEVVFEHLWRGAPLPSRLPQKHP